MSAKTPVVSRTVDLGESDPRRAEDDIIKWSAAQNAETIAGLRRENSSLRFLLKAELELQRALFRWFWDESEELIGRGTDGKDRLVRIMSGEDFAYCLQRALYGTLPRYLCQQPRTCTAGLDCGAGYECAEAAKDDRDAKTKFETRAPMYLISALKVKRAAEAKAGEEARP